MKIIIESPDMKASPSLKEFITKKISKLERFASRVLSAEVTIETEPRKSGDVIKCSIILKMPGKDEYVIARSRIFEDAVLKAKEAAERRLRIRKTQRETRRKS